MKAPRHWPLWGEFTDDRWILLTKGQWRGHFFNLMTSSWVHECRLYFYIPGAFQNAYDLLSLIAGLYMNKFCESLFKLTPNNHFNEKSTLVQKMVWQQAITWTNVEPHLLLNRILLLGVSRPQWVNLYILITISLFVEPDEFPRICGHCVHWQIILWSSFGACTSANGPNHFRFITCQLLSKRYNIRNICVMSGSLILCKPSLFSIQVYVSYVTQHEYHDDLWDV